MGTWSQIVDVATKLWRWAFPKPGRHRMPRYPHIQRMTSAQLDAYTFSDTIGFDEFEEVVRRQRVTLGE